jgi:hypothetical protein
MTLASVVRRIFRPSCLPMPLMVGFSTVSTVWFILALCSFNVPAINVHGMCILYSVAFFWCELCQPHHLEKKG